MAREQKKFFIEKTGAAFMVTDYDWEGAEMHWHNYWEMLVQCEGETRMTVHGEQFVSRPGNVTIIEPNCLHETKSITARHKILLLQFEKSVLLPFVGAKAGKTLLPLLMDDGFLVKHRIADADQKELVDTFFRMKEIDGQKALGYELEIYSCLMHIMYLLFRKEYITIPQMEDEKRKALLAIRKAVIYIDQHFQEKIRQEDMADMCYMSTAHFSREFKTATGENMVDYVNQLRLKEAVRLLISSKYTILEISQMVGFSTVNYFNRVFKTAYSVSPREYRNKIV